MMEKIRADIRDFKAKKKLDKVSQHRYIAIGSIAIGSLSLIFVSQCCVQGIFTLTLACSPKRT